SYGSGEQGLFYQGTRFLSRFSFALGDDRPLLLSSWTKSDNALIGVDMTNPDIHRNNNVVLQRGSLHVFRSKFLWEPGCYEILRIRNYGHDQIEIEFSSRISSDFADIFEVRGARRERRGEILDSEFTSASVTYKYRGLDGVIRKTRVESNP